MQQLQFDRLPLTGNNEGKYRLLRSGKARQISMRCDVGAMPLKSVMRYVQTDFMESGSPCRKLRYQRVFELPLRCALLQKAGSRIRHARRLRFVDVETPRQRMHAPVARIFMLQPANMVIKKSFA